MNSNKSIYEILKDDETYTIISGNDRLDLDEIQIKGMFEIIDTLFENSKNINANTIKHNMNIEDYDSIFDEQNKLTIIPIKTIGLHLTFGENKKVIKNDIWSSQETIMFFFEIMTQILETISQTNDYPQSLLLWYRTKLLRSVNDYGYKKINYSNPNSQNVWNERLNALFSKQRNRFFFYENSIIEKYLKETLTKRYLLNTTQNVKFSYLEKQSYDYFTLFDFFAKILTTKFTFFEYKNSEWNINTKLAKVNMSLYDWFKQIIFEKCFGKGESEIADLFRDLEYNYRGNNGKLNILLKSFFEWGELAPNQKINFDYFQSIEIGDNIADITSLLKRMIVFSELFSHLLDFEQVKNFVIETKGLLKVSKKTMWILETVKYFSFKNSKYKITIFSYLSLIYYLFINDKLSAKNFEKIVRDFFELHIKHVVVLNEWGINEFEKKAIVNISEIWHLENNHVFEHLSNFLLEYETKYDGIDEIVEYKSIDKNLLQNTLVNEKNFVGPASLLRKMILMLDINEKEKWYKSCDSSFYDRFKKVDELCNIEHLMSVSLVSTLSKELQKRVFEIGNTYLCSNEINNIVDNWKIKCDLAKPSHECCKYHYFSKLPNEKSFHSSMIELLKNDSSLDWKVNVANRSNLLVGKFIEFTLGTQ